VQEHTWFVVSVVSAVLSIEIGNYYTSDIAHFSYSVINQKRALWDFVETGNAKEDDRQLGEICVAELVST
jgi:hypothetical protein